MKYIPINYDDAIYQCQVDDEDYEYLNQYRWFYHPKTGVMRKANKKSEYLHRVIMNCPKGFVVDHIDHNTFNNQKSNLRICTQSQNSKNQKLPKNNTSGYKGVSYDTRKEKLKKRWSAQIKVNRKFIRLGRFLTALEAAIAYDNAAIKYFGKFADLNFKE